MDVRALQFNPKLKGVSYIMYPSAILGSLRENVDQPTVSLIENLPLFNKLIIHGQVFIY